VYPPTVTNEKPADDTTPNGEAVSFVRVVRTPLSCGAAATAVVHGGDTSVGRLPQPHTSAAQPSARARVTATYAIVRRVDEQELRAVVEARKELGPEHEEHLISGFLERIDKEIDRRVDEKVAARRPRSRKSMEAELGIFIPIFIIAGIFAGFSGIVAAAVALVVIFLVSELRR
jgi:hypothetical protein